MLLIDCSDPPFYDEVTNTVDFPAWHANRIQDLNTYLERAIWLNSQIQEMSQNFKDVNRLYSDLTKGGTCSQACVSVHLLQELQLVALLAELTTSQSECSILIQKYIDELKLHLTEFKNRNELALIKELHTNRKELVERIEQYRSPIKANHQKLQQLYQEFVNRFQHGLCGSCLHCGLFAQWKGGDSQIIFEKGFDECEYVWTKESDERINFIGMELERIGNEPISDDEDEEIIHFPLRGGGR